MDPYSDELNWLYSRRDRMIDQLSRWCEINTGSYNTAGLSRQLDLLKTEFGALADEVDVVSLPPHRTANDEGDVVERPLGDLLMVSKRPGAQSSVFLGGHMDTVFGRDHEFQTVERTGPDRLVGPGVTDDKGGLIILLYALKAFEKTSLSDRVGWEVFVNPDEEIGSPGSAEILRDRAKDHDIGLIVEPAMPDGSMVTRRKGSGNFTIVVEGETAHAGRNPDDGADAIALLSSLIVELNDFGDAHDGIICNVGRISGGGPVNVVPDRAVAHLNVRTNTREEQRTAEGHLQSLLEQADGRDGFQVTLHGSFLAPPKPLDPPTRELFEAVTSIANGMDMDPAGTDSGGISDGNHLAAAGLPTLDTLGPVGGKIHSAGEYLQPDSLPRRADLLTRTLLHFAEGTISERIGTNRD